MAYLRFLYWSSLWCVLRVTRSIHLYEFLVQVKNVDLLDESSPSWANGRCWYFDTDRPCGYDSTQDPIIKERREKSVMKSDSLFKIKIDFYFYFFKKEKEHIVTKRSERSFYQKDKENSLPLSLIINLQKIQLN